MYSVLVLSGCLNSSDEFFGLNFKPNQFVGQMVDEVRQGKGHREGFFVALRKIETLLVDGFVSCKATCVAHPLKLSRQSQAFDLLIKSPAFSSATDNKALQANAQQGPRGSRRKCRDFLSLAKNFPDVARHAFDWLDAASRRIDGFLINPEHQSAAVAASTYRIATGIVKVKEVLGLELHDPWLVWVTDAVHLVCRFPHRSCNGSEFHLGTNPAVRACK